MTIRPKSVALGSNTRIQNQKCGFATVKLTVCVHGARRTKRRGGSAVQKRAEEARTCQAAGSDTDQTQLLMCKPAPWRVEFFCCFALLRSSRSLHSHRAGSSQSCVRSSQVCSWSCLWLCSGWCVLRHDGVRVCLGVFAHDSMRCARSSVFENLVFRPWFWRCCVGER